MPEPLTLALISELMPKLYAAFPRTIKDDGPMVVETYRNGLRGISGDAVRAAVDRAIQEDTYFPKVSRLRELGLQWQRTNTVVLEARAAEVPWYVCPVCGAHAEHRTIVRRKRDPEKGYALIVPEEWEEGPSAMMYMTHDPRKHGVFPERAG